MTSDQTSPQLTDRLAQLSRPFRLIVTGGGTGGHTYPALTAIRELQRCLAQHSSSLDVLWIGTASGLESRVAAQEDIPFAAVPAGKLRRASNPLRMLNAQNLRDILRVPAGVIKARAIVAKYRADVVLSTGGYVAVPVGLAAKLTATPLIVHEQTVRLGLANRLLARIATTVAVSSESTLKLLPSKARSVVTGNPVRAALFTGDSSKAIPALGLPGFDPALPTVYITGGAPTSVPNSPTSSPSPTSSSPAAAPAPSPNSPHSANPPSSSPTPARQATSKNTMPATSLGRPDAASRLVDAILAAGLRPQAS